VKAVVPELDGSILVRVPPPALYPVPDTSLVAVYAVVDASKDALLSYIASLNVSPPDSKKLCLASINSFLKLVHMKLPVKAML
jgi:hypothetical protein